MSLKIATECYVKLLDKGPNKENSPPFIISIIRLFSSTYLLWVMQGLKVEKKINALLIEQYKRFEEIQECLSKAQPKLQGQFFNKWAHGSNPLFTSEKTHEVILKETRFSYAILPFPFHDTIRRKLKEQKPIDHYEKIQVSGTEFLFAFMSNKPLELKEKTLFCLQRTFFTHYGLYEEKKFLDWPSLLIQWANDQTKQQRLKELFQLFKKSIPSFESFPKKQTLPYAVQIDSFSDWIAERSIHSLEKIWGFSFTENFSKDMLAAFIKDDRTRLDCLYFAGYQKEKLSDLPEFNRLSTPFVEAFKKLTALPWPFEILDEDRAFFLECLFRTNAQIENNYQKFFPEGSQKFATHEILEWMKLHNKETNGIYLLAYFTKFPSTFDAIKNRGLGFPDLSATQTISILRNQGENRLRLMDRFDETWKDLDAISPFNQEQKKYLFGLKDEKAFILGTELLKKIQNLLERPLDPLTAFRFLMSNVKLESVHESTLSFLNSLCSTQDKISAKSTLREAIYLLASVCDDHDTMEFPVTISEWLVEKFSLNDEPEDEVE